MSKWLEYLSLIPKGLKNPEKVLEGMLNSVKNEFNLLSQDEQEEIVRRRLICSTCPLMSLNSKRDSKEYKKLFGIDFVTDRNDDFCTICLCPIRTKTASFTSECGLSEYNNKHPENKQDLKWGVYQK